MGDEPDDEDRSAILRRRNRFVSLALSGLAAGALGACQACLSPSPMDAGGIDAGRDGGVDAEPQACLTPLLDAGPEDAGIDAEPMACLTPLEDAGAGDAGPDDGGHDAAA